ncbi:sterol O-acyltransferase 1-like isoform X2 [Brevipalpus obovatus]|uniref:sterol O-acyltransferase 1-like isoform X2 n=1 Tax=Brevipalpus obovatus TaxID=246614 RepID=UPI003D9E3EDD
MMSEENPVVLTILRHDNEDLNNNHAKNPLKNDGDTDGVFEKRSSIFSELYQSDSTIRILAILIRYFLIIITVSVLWENILDEKNFKRAKLVFYLPFRGLFPYGLGIFVFNHLWAIVQLILLRSIDKLWLFSLVQVLMITIYTVFPLFILLHINLGFVVRFFIAIEQVGHKPAKRNRYILKHSYNFQVRIAMKVWSLISETFSSDSPTLGQFFYFLFAPTLIFRKKYPMSPHRDWSSISCRIFQSIILIIPTTKLIDLLFSISIEIVSGVHPLISWQVLLFSSIGYAILVMLIWFYFFHAWSNLWADLLRFDDRKFYSMFWTSDSVSGLVVGFNRIVHLFIKFYIHKPIAKRSKNIFLGYFLVFFVSAIFHEYICIVGLASFLPVWLAPIIFTPILALLNINAFRVKFSNQNLFVGLVLFDFLYHPLLLFLEFAARDLCEVPETFAQNPMVKFLIPHILFCNIKVY